jgi:transglutaminase-like putative cysteine protease
MLDRLCENVAVEFDVAPRATTAAQAFADGRGTCRELTHIFIAAARSLDVPARYVSGYIRQEGDATTQQAISAWAEAYVPGLAWVAFDPANGICATDAYVRIAVGLDRLGAAAVRGTRSGGTGEVLTVKLKVEQAAQQNQN